MSLVAKEFRKAMFSAVPRIWRQSKCRTCLELEKLLRPRHDHSSNSSLECLTWCSPKPSSKQLHLIGTDFCSLHFSCFLINWLLHKFLKVPSTCAQMRSKPNRLAWRAATWPMACHSRQETTESYRRSSVHCRWITRGKIWSYFMGFFGVD
jgi:hypothetical protein